MVEPYKALEEAYVRAKGLASTCGMTLSPQMTCEGGNCAIVN